MEKIYKNGKEKQTMETMIVAIVGIVGVIIGAIIGAIATVAGSESATNAIERLIWAETDSYPEENYSDEDENETYENEG